jgi:hypothetical protein
MAYKVKSYEPGIADHVSNEANVWVVAAFAAIRMYGRPNDWPRVQFPSHVTYPLRKEHAQTVVRRLDGHEDGPGHFIARAHGEDRGRMFHVGTITVDPVSDKLGG